MARGLALLHRPLNIQSSADPHRQEALRCFEQALAGAPDLIPAKIGIATVLVTDVALGYRPRFGPEEARIEQLLTDILRVDGTIGLAHTALGMLRQIQWRFDEALVEIRIAAALIPNHATTIGHHGMSLAFGGQPEAAIPLLERSLRLSPHDYYAPVSQGFPGLCHLLLGDPAQAILSLRTALAMNPRIFLFHAWLAAALGLHGAVDEARAALGQALDMFPGLVGMVSSVRFANPAYVALFGRTIYPGLLRA